MVATKRNEQIAQLQSEINDLKGKLISQEKLASLGSISAEIAHDINNSINFIRASIDPVKDNLNLLIELINKMEATFGTNKHIEQYKKEIEYDYTLTETTLLLNNIIEGVEQLFSIVNNVVSYAKPDKKTNKVDLNHIIATIISLVKLNRKGKIAFKQVFDNNLPLVKCNTGRIKQLMMNLLVNAVDAIEDNGVITIFTNKIDDDQVEIRIKDTGVGMSKKISKKIFDPFFTTKTKDKGTGLGMSIVKEIVEEHNGSITMSSEINHGTEFIIKLPIG